ncbi:ROK family protein [Rubripirellula reticaptiva]|uniref:Glucokinase n=1 Tax=Rubripirellula reticaptiva TaxID=2528013 RepID=A0A5C6EHG3_9BACT|nr:ROK family protein [Rubripirellula reticaptiva]TWU48258.1 Glucokinase [Rubripirellula reticaptiva]
MQRPTFLGDLYLGIDVGGTNVKVGLVDDSGTMIKQGSAATPVLKTPEKVFQFAINFANQYCQHFDIAPERLKAVGLAVPGVLDTREYVLREVVNLPGWLGQPLNQILSSVCQRPTIVTNDANAAAYAEHEARNLGEQSLALVTLGTGVGCGVVAGGRPHGGDHGCAGEIGHITINFDDDALPCTCGSRGHLESYAGAAGVIKRLQNLLNSEASGSQKWTTLEIADAAEAGNAICIQVIDETAVLVGRAIGMLGQGLDPAVVLLGGAMTFGGDKTETGRRFLQRIRATVKATTLVQVGGNMKVEFATLGNDAGVLGAAMVAKKLSRQPS